MSNLPLKRIMLTRKATTKPTIVLIDESGTAATVSNSDIANRSQGGLVDQLLGGFLHASVNKRRIIMIATNKFAKNSVAYSEQHIM